MLRAEAAAALLEPEPLPWSTLRVALPMHRPGAARCAAVRPCRCACGRPPTHPPHRSHSRFLAKGFLQGRARPQMHPRFLRGSRPKPLKKFLNGRTS
jgi:hypothetical protein